MTLDQWPARTPAVVREVARPTSLQAQELVLRLTEIGFVPGEVIAIVATGPMGREPLAVRVGHTTFALRRQEAQLIEVQAVPEAQA